MRSFSRRQRATEIEMRWIFGKLCPILREIFFLKMGELLLTWTGDVDAMVCPVVNLAPQ